MRGGVNPARHKDLAFEVDDLRVRERAGGLGVVGVPGAAVPYSRDSLAINGKGSLLRGSPCHYVGVGK